MKSTMQNNRVSVPALLFIIVAPLVLMFGGTAIGLMLTMLR